MSDRSSPEVSRDEDDDDKTRDVEFVKPMPVSPPKSDKFKKPILIGPRKGSKKNPATTNANLNKIMELNAKFAEEKSKSVISKELHQEVDLTPKKEVAEFPLVVSDFSDKVLPAEFPYTEPQWKGIPDEKYFLEELKSGVIEKEIDLGDRSFTVLGRLDHCHVMMAHPTISRYHAVLQYRSTRQGIYDKGFYLYDLGSTHGTFLNKNRIKPQTYVRIQVGHVMKFGCSTRLFILQGPNEDEEPESEFSVTELKEMRKQELLDREKKLEAEKNQKLAEEARKKEELESKGVDWGMSEDADEETDLSENPYAVTNNEELYAEDPKKELKKWFEREGEELNIEVEQAERGKMVCRITLPLDNGKGGDMVIESTGKSKKEATFSCALEACRHIDRVGLFRQSQQESKKRQQRDWEENDYYDSDEDSYFDRTGDVDEKRQKRMKKAGKLKDTVETYDSLVKNHEALLKKIAQVEKKYAEMTQTALGDLKPPSEDADELDEYMHSLQQNAPNKLEIKICKVELNNLKEEETRLVSLINLAKPASLPELKPFVPTNKMPKPSGSRQDQVASVKIKNPIPKSVESEEIKGDNSKRLSEEHFESSEHEMIGEEFSLSDDSSRTTLNTVIGPSLPDLEFVEPSKKHKRSRNRQRDRSQKMTDSTKFDLSDYSDLTWQPPEGQTGDGRTSLNEKYGY